MRSIRSFLRHSGAPLMAVALATACDMPQRIAAPVKTLGSPSLDKRDDDGGLGGSFNEFTGLASSAVCTVPGGDPLQPLILATGFTQSIVASEPRST